MGTGSGGAQVDNTLETQGKTSGQRLHIYTKADYKQDKGGHRKRV